MKKLSFSIVAILFACIAFVSCQGSSTDNKSNDKMKMEDKMKDDKMDNKMKDGQTDSSKMKDGKM